MSNEMRVDDLVVEAHGEVTLPPGWHYDENGEPVQDEGKCD